MKTKQLDMIFTRIRGIIPNNKIRRLRSFIQNPPLDRTSTSTKLTSVVTRNSHLLRLVFFYIQTSLSILCSLIYLAT